MAGDFCQSCDDPVPDGVETCDLCVANAEANGQAERDRRAADEHEERVWSLLFLAQREAAIGWIRWATSHD